MKMNKKLLVLGATFALAAQFGTIAMAASVPGTATTLVLVPLSIAETTQMNFGTIAGGPIADEIVMNSAGTRNVTGTSASIIATGSGAGALFTITGEPSQAYTFSISDTATLDDGAAGATMLVDTFTFTPTTILDGSGNDTVAVGASLAVGANQAAGTYNTTLGSGSPYTAIVNYD
jgi:hypothetical protein